MYALRIIESNGQEVSLYLGDYYTITKFDYADNQLFINKFSKVFGSGGVQEKHLVSGFIDTVNLPNSLPLYHTKQYYIVTLDNTVIQKLDLVVPPQPVNLPKEVAISLGIIKE